MAERKSVAFDPAVAAILGDGDKRQAARHLSPKARKEAARQAQRVRVTYDVPAWLRDVIMEGAEAEYVSASSLAAYLLAVGFREWRAGRAELLKRPSESPRFESLVEVSEDDAGLRR